MRRTRFCLSLAAFSVASVNLSCLPNLAAQSTDTVETQILEWMKTERLISQEENAWAAEKQIIDDMLSLMKTEKETLEEKIASAEELSSAADEERAAIEAEKESLELAADAYAEIIIKAEDSARALITKLPQPLLDEIQPLVARLPKDSNDTALSLSQRTQNIVGMLSQLDKFNSGVTYLSEIREVSAGENVEVHTLYFGLGAAYFVDTKGVTAGYGTPGTDGWEWTTDTSLAPTIQQMLSIYQQTATAEFLSLPVTLR